MMCKISNFIWAVMLFCTFAIFTDSMSTEYFVDNRHPQASDSNSGLEESPWLTIQHAAIVMEAGDICFVKEGVYPERIMPANSGQPVNLITFKAMGNVIVFGFQLQNKQYIRIIGFEFTHNNSLPQYEGTISLLSSDGCEILDNYLHHTYYIGIWFLDPPSNNILISGNKFAYIGSVPGYEVGAHAIKIWGNNNIVEYNDISHVADFLNVWGKGNIVRNNYFHDCYYSDFPDYHVEQGHHIDGLQYWSDNRMLLTNTLVENNYFSDNVVMHAHIIFLEEDYETGSSRFIFRNNVGLRNGSYPFSAEHMDYCKVFNNTFVDVLCAQSPKALACSGFLNYANYGSFINNVFYNSVRDGGGVYSVDSTSEHGFYGDYNFAFNSNNPNATWSAPIRDEIHSILNQDPRFIKYTNDDFHLQRNSPCISAAGPLTSTASSGNGYDIRVYDAKYFTDGWGNTEGDNIKVGANDSLKILAIDYDNNIITVDKNISWNSGDNVNLVYQGAAPDRGAFEYRADENYQFDVNIIRPSNNSHVNGVVTIKAEAINEDCIRHVIFYVNGISKKTINRSPFSFTWNTDELQNGNYIIEARAYSLHANTELMRSSKIKLVRDDSVHYIEPPIDLRFIR